MRYPSDVKVESIEHSVARAGFADPYYKVTFSLTSDGIPSTEMSVWVHSAFPEGDLVRVARTFLWSRLAALSEAASEGCFSEAEIHALWQRVEPENFTARR